MSYETDSFTEYLEEQRRNREAVNVGDSFWTVPWGLDFDTDGQAWLRVGYIEPRFEPPRSYETFRMHVTLVSETECTVDISRCPDYAFSNKRPIHPNDPLGQDLDNPQWLLVGQIIN